MPQVVGAGLKSKYDEPVEDPSPDPAEGAGRVARGGHQPDSEQRAGRRGVGADLLVEREERGPDQRDRRAPDQRHAHEQHPDRQQQPSHSSRQYRRRIPRLQLMTNDVHITPEGLVAVQKELIELTTVRRPAIVAKIKAAREFGDLSENFEYHAAKNEQGMMEARINELEAVVKNHVLIESRKSNGVVSMGSTVRFQEDGEGEESYRIVGPAEADPKSGRVSYESALGKALIGHRVGEEVEIRTPNAAYRVRIVGVD